jgi:hypothetical protein
MAEFRPIHMYSNYNNMQWNKIQNNDSLIDEIGKGIHGVSKNDFLQKFKNHKGEKARLHRLQKNFEVRGEYDGSTVEVQGTTRGVEGEYEGSTRGVRGSMGSTEVSLFPPWYNLSWIGKLKNYDIFLHILLN